MAQNGLMWQKTRWLGSLLAIWLLAILPVRSAELVVDNERQTFISSTYAGPIEDDHSDYTSVVYIHAPIALISPIAGFSFLSSPGFLPPSLLDFYRSLLINVSGTKHQSYFAFGFLRLIFEHQITINAP